MSKFYTVCSLPELKSARTLGYTVNDLDLFVVYHDSKVHAYKNSCPHIGMNLEFSENKFLDSENAYIQCSMHGALFEIDTGRCIHGPCLKQSLSPLEVAVENNVVQVRVA